MFGLKTYMVFMKPEAEDPLETVKFVRDGFSFMAVLFNFFWALYHRIWWLATISFAFSIAAELLEQHDMITPDQHMVLSMGYFIFIGLHAHDWLAAELQRRGFAFVAVVMGRNEEEAEQRFFDQHLQRLRKKQTLDPASVPAM